MKKLAKRLLSCALAAALAAGMCLTASAFTYPGAYWALHSAWDEAVAAKDPDQVISVAQQVYDLLTPLGLGQDVCANLWPKSQTASWACEIKGDIDGAITWAERQYTFAKWLTDNVGDPYNYKDLLEGIEARLRALRAAQNVTVYAQSDNDPSGYSKGPRTGTWYGVPADGSRSDGSAALVYINFGDSYSVEYWLDYYQHNSALYQKAADGGVIELAWNFDPPDTSASQAVLTADSYISESLRAMSKVNATILLRVGAEMNCWENSDPEVFKQAFRKVASAARAYPNIQMVFSPNDISNRNVTMEMYYPGDEYVDWIGMSTYHSSNYNGWYGASSYDFDYSRFYDDAFYGVGIYDNDPLVTIQPFVDLAKAHNKPVMISECGSSWRGADNSDQTAYAVEQVNWIYSYVNMVYPQVKAVFYYDNSQASSSGLVYRLDTSSAVNSAYENAIRKNGAYLTDAKGSATNWEPLDRTTLSEGGGILRLAAYASFPGRHATTVRYYVDNSLVYTSSEAPYYYDLDVAGLSGGDHTVRVDASGGQFSRSSQTYTLIVPGGTPSVDPEPEQPGTSLAVAGNQNIEIDGKAVAFQTYMLADANGNGTNYVKLRDIAHVLNGTAAQFSVGYDRQNASISATTGAAYKETGTEMDTPFAGADKEYVQSQLTIVVNGAPVQLDAITLMDDAGGGYNYFKLRDLGGALDFKVGYSRDRGVYIETE